MTKNPFINAVVAVVYIKIVSFIMYYGTRLAPENKDFIIPLVPMAVISLFTLSAAVMGYVFLYQPIIFYLEGQKKEAVNLFLKTVGVFAIFTALIFFLLFFLAM